MAAQDALALSDQLGFTHVSPFWLQTAAAWHRALRTAIVLLPTVFVPYAHAVPLRNRRHAVQDLEALFASQRPPPLPLPGTLPRRVSCTGPCAHMVQMRGGGKGFAVTVRSRTCRTGSATVPALVGLPAHDCHTAASMP